MKKHSSTQNKINPSVQTLSSNAPNAQPFEEHKATLSRRDVIAFERRLLAMLNQCITFEGHSILFPKTTTPQSPTWIKEESRLLLPLYSHKTGLLGIFLARGVAEEEAQKMLDFWPALAPILVENLLLYKQSLCDQATGLYSKHYLLQQVSLIIEHVRDPLRQQPSHETDGAKEKGKADGTQKDVKNYAQTIDATPKNIVQTKKEPASTALLRPENLLEHNILHSGSLSLIVIRLSSIKEIVREFGYQFADALIAKLAEALQTLCPEQALPIRTGDLEFALLLPASTPKQCHTLATLVSQTLRDVSLEHSLRHNQVNIAPNVGYALYPQNADPTLLLRSAQNQSAHLLRQARIAAAFATEQPAHSTQGEITPVMAFAHILQEGGRVIETLPLSRVIINLGSAVHAKEGMRFSVWTTDYPVTTLQKSNTPLPPLYKGEIVLIQVQENASLAEIMHVGDPSWLINPSDTLHLLPKEQGGHVAVLDQPATPDPVTGLLRHGDFLVKWIEQREGCQEFCISLLRVAPAPLTTTNDTQGAFTEQNIDSIMSQVAELCREEFSTVLGGRYGLTSLIFFHPHKETTPLTATFAKIIATLEKRLPITIGLGIAPYPCLEFRKADTLENSRKSLEYGILLPNPHIGCLDSLALNINADKLFSQGNMFEAIKEYQNALMLDEKNNMAWNSLGICLANLGRYAEAEEHFAHSLAIDSKDSMTWYNLAYIQQLQNNEKKAEEYFNTCLKHEATHIFALIRLGQLAENKNDFALARSFYERAADLPEGKNVTFRHFARLCMLEKDTQTAREYLHEALLADPQDAVAMYLLARLYLDEGEDPDLAASFARQSVSIRPDLKLAWLELARALEALGQHRQAKQAFLNAGEL